MPSSFNNTDEYIRLQPEAVQPLLLQLRQFVAKAAPHATVAIKYGIPSFVQQGNLVHFAAFKKHIGFYPGPTAILAFEGKLAPYHCSKGASQFPINQRLPLSLITKMIKLRVKQKLSKASTK
jgi:uncharacterized protein YdhG (YjbR/CyaY superfamily)